MHRVPRYQITRIREGSVPFHSYPRFTNSRDVFEQFRSDCSALPHEEMHLITLDNKNRMIGLHKAFQGALSQSLVMPREIMARCLLDNAAAFVIFHNHPSGDCAPSREDRDCTQRIAKAAQIMGIKLLDHLVMGDTDYFSFADAGIMQEEPAA